jgi:hypothetical protein
MGAGVQDERNDSDGDENKANRNAAKPSESKRGDDKECRRRGYLVLPEAGNVLLREEGARHQRSGDPTCTDSDQHLHEGHLRASCDGGIDQGVGADEECECKVPLCDTGVVDEGTEGETRPGDARKYDGNERRS